METPEYTIYEEDCPKITPAILKAKVAAFETLYDCRAEVLVSGDWYGPINGNESPDYSIHSRYRSFKVVGIGSKYIAVDVNGSVERVLIVENWSRRPTGATKIIIREREA